MTENISSKRPFGIDFTPLSEEDLAELIASAEIGQGAGVRSVVTANVAHIVELLKNPEFRMAYSHAWKATADGMPVYLYARLRGTKLPRAANGIRIV